MKKLQDNIKLLQDLMNRLKFITKEIRYNIGGIDESIRIDE